MTHQEYLEFHKGIVDKMMAITKAKNNDYTGATNDAFANFKHVESFGVATVEQGFFTRMSDKLSRISSFISKGELQVKDESVTDTLCDLANYCILFMGYLSTKQVPPAVGIIREVGKNGRE